MSALTALRMIAAGERPHGELLPPCRLEAFGVEGYGEEAIVQSFRSAPLEISASAEVILPKAILPCSKVNTRCLPISMARISRGFGVWDRASLRSVSWQSACPSIPISGNRAAR